MSDIYLVAGGDMRFFSVAEQIAQKDTVYMAGFDKSMISSDKIIAGYSISELYKKADHLILPLPAADDDVTLNAPFYKGNIYLSELADTVKDGGTVFGGRLSARTRDIFSSRGLEVIDYFDREELSVQNALATAEGALKIALEEQPCMLSGERVLILGMGRIAKSLIRILTGFGVHITAAARKYSDLAWAEVFGCEGVRICESELIGAAERADLIFNTIPHMVLNENVLSHCRKSCLIIDLASKPGGMDFEAAGRLGLTAIWALSLPGKTAPVSSGRMIARAVENILAEKKGAP